MSEPSRALPSRATPNGGSRGAAAEGAQLAQRPSSARRRFSGSQATASELEGRAVPSALPGSEPDAMAAGLLLQLRSSAPLASMPENSSHGCAPDSRSEGEVLTGHRRNQEAALGGSPGPSRERKRARIAVASPDEPDVSDARSFVDAEVERADDLVRRNRSHFLGFYNDAPTLDMLTDLEVFMFTQRQRWFEHGRLHAWLQYERELSHSETPHDQSSVLEEIQAANRILSAKNTYLCQKVEALSDDLNGLESRFDDCARSLDAERRDNRRLLDMMSGSGTEPSRTRQLPRARVAQPAPGDYERLQRTVAKLIEELVDQRWKGEQLLHDDTVPQQYSSRMQWKDTFCASLRDSLVREYGEESPPPLAVQPLQPRDGHHVAPLPEAPSARPASPIVLVSGSDDLDFFDPETAPYDQQRFVEASLALDQRLSQSRHVALQSLPEPSYAIPPHYIWTTEQYRLPVPLGKFGQPFWSGSAWEEFNPMRLYRDLDGGKVERGDELWIRLAQDAVKFPFEFRSNAQRIVVSEAHRFKPDGASRPVLPLAGEVPEVDVWHQCANNAVYLPLAIRRQYSYKKSTRTLYREWDAGDLGIYLLLRACGPENKSRKEKKQQSATEPTKWSSWSAQVRAAVVWADAHREVWREHMASATHSTPRRYSGSGEPQDVFYHLARRGFNTDRMMRSGDVYQYLERAERLEKRLQELKADVSSGRTSGLDHGAVLAVAKCRMELEEQSLPNSRPVVRCQVRSTDPVAAEHLKRLQHEL